MSSINYTVIIPHYNIPHLLDRCLKSIPIRDDLQIIVVDDCSDTLFLKQVKEMEAKYPAAMFIYSSENGGGGKARNIGMHHALGRYLIFADADDFFTEDFSKILDSQLSSTDDIIYFRNYNVLSNNCTISLNHTKGIDDIFDRFASTHDFSEITCCIFNPWAKFYRRAFIIENNIRFDETYVSNDVFFVVSAACYAKSRTVTQDVIYYYTERDDSTTSTYAKKKEELKIRIEVCYRAQQLMKKFGYKIKSMPLSYFLHRAYCSDLQLFKEYLKKSPNVYDSLWDAIFQIRCFIPNRLEKIALYVRSLFWYYS